MVTFTTRALEVRLGRETVLRGIDSTLEAGQFIGVIGPNGAGKSTFVRALLGLVEPSAGTVMLDGTDLAAWTRPDIARQLAYLPQGQTLHWPLSVERVVALGRIPHLPARAPLSAHDHAAIEQAMQRADVTALRQRRVDTLSGGERARVLFARALAVEAAGLIADEPLASLDPGHQIDVMALLAQEARRGKLVIAVLHDLTLAARYCDRLLLIDNGRLCADGAPLDVLTPARLEAVYGIRAFIVRDPGGPMIVPLERDRNARPLQPALGD
ncbi:ABC transporter ATP-binding protein [Novosphingobium sp. 1949]|uniref:ABC transporter ATP-binding protein n=1 Tax=Novosphingobium organovorum TaxID=2930092 RepID=A0ABT0B8S4_9SPHN|nr:ABC transporter ATP-binding protein [Novosphingobium organovorum]MCJ2181466.1 ABC transporter ATP-binding protein [Novosphingobium organovorum]